MMRAAAWLVLAAVLGGCVLGAPPADHFYRLDAPAPQPLPRPRFEGTIEVGAFKATGLLNERALLFAQESRPLELHLQRYHYWTDAPGRLLQEDLVRFLRAANVATAVVLPQAGARPKYIVAGRIERLEQIVGRAQSTASIQLELAFRRATGEMLHVASYQADERIEGKGDTAAVEAFNRALGQIFTRFLADIGA